MTSPYSGRLGQHVRPLRCDPRLEHVSSCLLEDAVLLAAQVCQAPIALLGGWTPEHHWLQAAYGTPLNTVPLDQSPCVQWLQRCPSLQMLWVVPDLSAAIAARQLPSTVLDHPVVAGLGLGFYAAVPLLTSTGQLLGTLAIFDQGSRQLDLGQQQSLQAIARQVMVYVDQLDYAAPIPELALTTQSHLLNLASDAIIALDLRGRITFWNQGAEQLYGWKKAQALGQDYRALLQPVTDSTLPTIQQTCMQRGEWEGIMVHSTRDRQRLTINSAWMLQLTDHGQPSLLLQINRPIRNYCDLDGIIHDQLPRSPESDHELFKHLPDGFIAVDDQWRVQHLNRRAEQILCCDRHQVLDQSLWTAIPGFADSEMEVACRRAVAQETELRFEYVYQPYGLVLELVACPYVDGMLLYLRDVTVHRQAVASVLEHTRLASLNTAVSQVLARAGSLADTLESCVQTLVDGLEEIVLARIWLFDPETNVLDLQAIAGILPPVPDLPHRISLGISIVGVIAQNQQPYLNNAAARDACLGLQDWAIQEGITAFLGYPLVVDDRLVGVMTLLSRRPIPEGTYATLEWIFGSMAIAIDLSIARAELLSRRESLLFRLASQIRNSLDLNTILGAAVQEIRHLLHIDGCYFLWCLQDETAPGDAPPTLAITHESLYTDLPSLLGECEPVLRRSLTPYLLHLNPLILDHTTDLPDTSELYSWLNRWGIQSFLLMPIETHAGQLGAILCSHGQASRHWSQAEVELLQAVTNQLAIAIDQAELYAQSRAAATAAQQQAQQLGDALQTLRQTQTKMIHSEKMSSLGQLVAGIAHEINNPVGFVSGNLTYAESYFHDLVRLLRLYQQHYPTPTADIQACIQNIELEFLLEDYASLLKSMKLGTDRISQIVQSLRSFSRLDEAEVKAVNLHEGIDNTLVILRSRLKANGTSPAIEVMKQYGDLPAIDCYASQMNQVFLNLLTNAIDALENQPAPRIITITTTTQATRSLPSGPNSVPAIRCEGEAQWIIIRIQDNGIGMAEDVRKKIFDPFFTTKPVGRGTGLGLSISHQIIEKHHGWLSCQSTPGIGTEFMIELPICLPLPLRSPGSLEDPRQD
jgi:two-component system NtrC family sensor kinase